MSPHYDKGPAVVEAARDAAAQHHAPDPLRVREPSIEWVEDEKPRRPVRAVYGTTPRLRASGQEYLPRNFEKDTDGTELGETPSEYARRLKKSVCYGYLQDAVDGNKGKVLKKPVSVDNTPEELEHLESNCDGEGTSLTSFAGWLIERGWQDGIDFFLVTVDTDEEGKPAEEAEPYFAHVPAKNLIGLKAVVYNGQTYVSQARILTTVATDDGEFHEKSNERVMVFDAGEPYLIEGEPGIPDWVYPRWRAYEVVTDASTEKAEWRQVDEGTIEIPQWDGESDEEFAVRQAFFIPLVPYYVDRKDFFRGHPPLETLSYLEICHWQKQSDLDNIEWAANVPRPYVTGVENPEDFAVVESGVLRTYAIKEPGARVGFWEHSGASVRELKESIKRLELRMLVESAEPQRGEVQRQETATGRVIDADRAASPLHASVLSLDDSLALGYLYSGWWKGLPLELEEVAVDVNKDLGSAMANMEIAGILLELAKLPPAQRIVGAETLLKQLVRRGVLPEDTDIEVETEALGDLLTTIPSPAAELEALSVTI